MMISSISDFFNQYLKPKEDEQVAEHLSKIHLACAALLFEVSKSDHSLDASETQALFRILEDKFDLPHATLMEMMELAEQEAKDATSLYQFTSLINEHYEYEEKVALIKDMWEVAYADNNLDRYEEHMIRKVADLIYISHRDFIQTKQAVLAD